MGDMWFTHTYDSKQVKQDSYYGKDWIPENISHRVVATWTPDLTGPTSIAHADEYSIAIHLPSHGAQANVEYELYDGCTGSAHKLKPLSLTFSQNVASSQGWYMLVGSAVQLCPGAKLELSNLTGDGGFSDDDVAYDAVAFIKDT